MDKHLFPAALILAAAPLWAQEFVPDISVHPASPALDEPFFVHIEGTFPHPCALEGNSFQTLEGDGMMILTLELELVLCPQVVTDLERTFGAFRLSSGVFSAGETVEIVFRGESELGRVEVTVAEPGEKTQVTPQSGMYWDPLFANNGVAVEAHGTDLFLAAYTYGEDGVATWRVAQGAMNSGHFEGELLAFAGGGCLLCGTHAPAQPTGEAVPVQLVFEGGQAAFLGTGAQPGRAMELRPFAQRLVESEPTIAAETFFMTDLGGRWLFTDTEDGALHVVTEIESAFSGFADGGIAFFASPERDVTIQCGRVIGPEAFACSLFLDEEQIGVAAASNVSHRFIQGDTFVGVRLE